MRLVENWRSAWKWLSLQMIALATIWESLPPDAIAAIPDPWAGRVTLFLLVGAGIGRMIDQGTKA
jgi:hypothetical protein